MSDDEISTDRWGHEPRAGNDTPPLFSYVRDKPYSNGMLTSQARTMSPAYIEFLKRNKERLNGRPEAD